MNFVRIVCDVRAQAFVHLISSITKYYNNELVSFFMHSSAFQEHLSRLSSDPREITKVANNPHIIISLLLRRRKARRGAN
jgi:hypothetical protein